MLSPFNVLHADDDQNDRELLKLAAFRHTVPIRVSEAGDGVEVIEYLQGTGRFADRARHPLPDLLLMELTMPRLNGFAVLEWLQDHSTFRSIPAIVLSASSFEQDIQEAYRCGAKTYFTKPV